MASVRASASWRSSSPGLQYGLRASSGLRITSPRTGYVELRRVFERGIVDDGRVATVGELTQNLADQDGLPLPESPMINRWLDSMARGRRTCRRRPLRRSARLGTCANPTPSAGVRRLKRAGVTSSGPFKRRPCRRARARARSFGIAIRRPTTNTATATTRRALPGLAGSDRDRSIRAGTRATSHARRTASPRPADDPQAACRAR